MFKFSTGNYNVQYTIEGGVWELLWGVGIVWARDVGWFGGLFDAVWRSGNIWR